MNTLSMTKYLLPLAILTGCEIDATTEIYEACFKTGMTEQMQGMEESDRYSVEQGVKKGCKILEDECKKNPKGKVCLTVKEKFGT